MVTHNKILWVSCLTQLLLISLLCGPTSRFLVDAAFFPNYRSPRNIILQQRILPSPKLFEASESRDETLEQGQNVANKTVVEGIGGKGGVVYDVNRLKRNLLQETMTAYKEELWELLADGNDDEIVEKLLALVQASPVRTTTDSNLLDGDIDWVLAYRSQFPTTVASLVLYENDGSASYNARYSFLWNDTSPGDKRTKSFLQGGILNKFKETFQTRRRTFRLEDLEDDEDAYVLDTVFLMGGLLTKTKAYSLEGLSRSSLMLRKLFSNWSLMGRTPKKQRIQAATQQAASSGQQGKGEKSVQIVYLDNDLCILTEQDGPDSPFMVYTRNKAYVNSYTSTKRKLKVLIATTWRVVTLPIRNLISGRRSSQVTYPSSSGLQRKRGKIGTASADDPMLKEIIRSEAKPKSSSSSAKMRVLRLGDVNEDDEDDSWESEADPFVHLTADERQEILKTMSVDEVERAANSYKSKTLRFRWLRKLVGRRKASFKRPPENYRRPKK